MHAGIASPMELLILFSMALGGGGGLPVGLPPGPEDPLLAKVAPEECLFYTSWVGAATPDANSPNQTEQLLAEPEVQHFVTDLQRQLTAGLRNVAQREGPEAAPLVEQVPRWVKTLLTRPTAIFVEDVKIAPGGPPEVSAAALVNVGDEAADLEAWLLKLQQMLPPGAVTTEQAGGDTWHKIKRGPEDPTVTWGLKGKYLIVTVGEGTLGGVLERARNGAPQWLTAAKARVPIERPSTFSYLNLKRIIAMGSAMGGPQAAQAIEALGLGNVEHLASATGLDQTGFVGRTLLALDGPPQGILSLAGQQPLAAADLAPVPRDATFALAVRLDAEQVLDTVLGVAEKIDPATRAEIAGGLQEVEQNLGIRVREDVLKPLGDTWCVYSSPSQSGLIPLGATAVVSVKDPQVLAATLEKLLAAARAQMPPAAGGRPGPEIRQFEFAGRQVYCLDAHEGDFPFAPSWCLTDKQLVVALFPQSIKAYLSRAAGGQSLAAAPEVAGLLEQGGGGPLALSYVDARPLFELAYPFIPMIAQAAFSQLAREGIDLDVSMIPSAPAIGRHLRPSVGVVRRTPAGLEIVSHQTLPGGSIGTVMPLGALVAILARTVSHTEVPLARSSNNLKQIGLAMHNYHDANRSFPAAYTADEQGNPLLSWRVAILPYLEEMALYEQFHLDEPWDSEHNKQLIDKMPAVYRAPGSRAGPGTTNYLTVRGEDTAFPGAKAVRIRDIADGTSYTIMVVEAADSRAVPWTKPADFERDAENPLAGLIGLEPGGFLAVFCDGSTKFIPATIAPETLRALFTRDGREVVDPAAF